MVLVLYSWGANDDGDGVWWWVAMLVLLGGAGRSW